MQNFIMTCHPANDMYTPSRQRSKRKRDSEHSKTNNKQTKIRYIIKRIFFLYSFSYLF